MVIEHYNLKAQTCGARRDSGGAHLDARVRPGQDPSTISNTQAGLFDRRALSNILASNRRLTEPGYIQDQQIMKIPGNQKVAGKMQSTREPSAVLRKFTGQRENR